VWLAKFLLVFGGAAPMLYMVYFTAARLDLTPAEAGGVVGVLFLAGYALQTAVALGGGWLSDRIGRRRPLFVASGLISAAGLILLATASNLPMIVAAQLVLSVSGGLFAAVDAVLVFQTLPNPDAPAKDLGVANLANGFPQVLLPLAATAVLAVGGGENYALLFAAAAAVAVCGALSVLRVKRVR
jgi:MFS family permease